MSLGKAKSVVLVGMQGHLIEVEADISQSIPAFVLLGLPDAGLRESQDRIKSAAKNTGLDLPRRRLTVNLYPASLPKTGTGLDLAIIMAAWAADEHVEGTQEVVFYAELGLNGRLRPVSGVLPVVAAAASAGVNTVVVAEENAAEAALVPGVNVYGPRWAGEVAAGFRAAGKSTPPVRELATVSPTPRQCPEQNPSAELDLSEVHGQHQARFALEVAAAGGHHMLLIGVPGAGKTMLAQRLPGILPRLDDAEAMEATAIASITDHDHPVTHLRRRRPFEAPHHSATVASIIGGGSRIPAPGAISRAHHGVLFLDEAPEFPRNALEALRQPLETGTIALHRSAAQVKYPARFQLVLAANPCPCGMNVGSARHCTCSVTQRRNYLSRISGPLLDRIDVQVPVERPTAQSLTIGEPAESSAEVRQRVDTARQAQRYRLSALGITMNYQMSLSLLTGALKLSPERTRSLDHALDRGQFSLRAYVKVLRLAWTLADLAQRDAPTAEDIDAAMQLRALPRAQGALV